MDPNRWANKSRMFGASDYHAEPTVAGGDDLHLITVNDPELDFRTDPPAYCHPNRFARALGEPCGHHGEDDVGDV